MNIYVFEYIYEVTDNYHSGGGAVVIAESLERAVELLESEEMSLLLFLRDKKAVKIPLGKNQEEKVWIFPDAGCCKTSPTSLCG